MGQHLTTDELISVVGSSFWIVELEAERTLEADRVKARARDSKQKERESREKRKEKEIPSSLEMKQQAPSGSYLTRSQEGSRRFHNHPPDERSHTQEHWDR